MNILFLTLLGFESIQEKSIYTDLLREFVKNDHNVFVISPVEKRYNQKTHLNREKNATILRLRIGNTQKTNIIEKGISTIMIEPMYKKAIKTYFPDIKFDLILYSTPPITFVSAIEYVKKRDGAKTYLLLKDIFPQNAVDIGLMTKTGVKGILYRNFRRKEEKLYNISDWIGCMSPANVEYIIRNNPQLKGENVEVCPNSSDIIDKSVDEETKTNIRLKYGIPLEKKVFVYGGNLGKPQGIPFVIQCLKRCEGLDNAFFVIVGDGTEYNKLDEYYRESSQKNMLLMKRLPKEDYDTLVGACDVGLIFLDHRFTIPNFPSRLLSYMQAKIPVFAITDPNTDLGVIISEAGFGYWCESNNVENVYDIFNLLIKADLKGMGEKGYNYFINNYTARSSYEIIAKHF